MEFTWNVEDCVFMNSDLDDMVERYSQEERIDAIVKYNDKIDILKQIELRKQFIEDAKNGIIKESQQWIDGDRCVNQFNYASLKSWCKKHGIDVDSYWNKYEDLIYLDRWGISNWSSHSAYCELNGSEKRFRAYIRDIFYHTLVMLRKREIVWFNTHDEWTVENNKLTNRCLYDINTYTGFDVWSSGNTYYENSDNARPLTLKELKAVNKFYDELEYKLNEFYNEVYKDFPLDKNNF